MCRSVPCARWVIVTYAQRGGADAPRGSRGGVLAVGPSPVPERPSGVVYVAAIPVSLWCAWSVGGVVVLGQCSVNRRHRSQPTISGLGIGHPWLSTAAVEAPIQEVLGTIQVKPRVSIAEDTSVG